LINFAWGDRPLYLFLLGPKHTLPINSDLPAQRVLESIRGAAFGVERTLLAKEQGRVVDHYACDFVGLKQVVHGFFQALLVVGAKIAVISDRYGEFLWMAALKPAGPCSSLEQLLIAKLFNEFLGIV